MPPRTVTIAARLAADLPALGIGSAGCLWPAALEADSLDFLILLDHAAAPPLDWRREDGAGGLLALAWAPLGVEVAAGDPSALLDAVDYLATRVDALLPYLPQGEENQREILAAALRRDLAGAPPGRPLGARFRAAPLAAPTPRAEARPSAPEVEDHRPVIPPRPRPRPSRT